ncbi:vanomycin resistance protein VanB [Acrocarpospora corrugata]|uniref:Vanomycin resistance protein VanB n=1 Tax=Acrocarpospora corrugata TaxID=35763 RepID=A0A5M3VVJ1_9ACTN|nr:VanW family protein [Acrocarpospora corrugata]GER99959.1 vanomycin resistance protein VanB [Acrocarpospora corrugata]
MRNAGASIDPPTDPVASAAPPVPRRRRQQMRAAPTGPTFLPPGVSSDIFGSRPLTAPTTTQESQLPPPLTVEPWPMAGTKPGAALSPELVPEPEDPHLRWGRLLAITLLIMVLLVYLVPAGFMTGGILPGTTILGVDLGGLSPPEAESRLRARMAGHIATAIVIKQGQHRVSLNPDDSGLSLDVPATIQSAPAGFPSPFEVWQGLTGHREIEPVIAVDRAKLLNVISTSVGRELEKKMVEGGVRFDGTRPVAIEPEAGVALDIEEIAADVHKAYLTSDLMVEVEPRQVRPTVTKSGVNEAVAWAKRAVAKPLTLVTKDAEVRLTPEAVAAHLIFYADGSGGLDARFDAAAAVRGLPLVPPELAPRDATFSTAGERPVLVKAKPGRAVDVIELGTAVIKAIGAGGSHRVSVPLTVARPALSDDEAATLGVTEQISARSAAYPCCQPRVSNIQTVARLLDGRVVKPGETFSLNAATGRREGVAGYSGSVEAVDVRGKRGQDVAGISQFATAMYQAVLYAGLETVEATPHETFVPQYPPGLEVAISYPGPDLRWRNDSPYGVLIRATATGTAVTVALWSTAHHDVEVKQSGRTKVVPATTTIGPAENCAPITGVDGFTIRTTRTSTPVDGGDAKTETITTTYRPQGAVVCPPAAE